MSEQTERDWMVEVLHRELGRMVDRGYLASALFAAGVGDLDAARAERDDLARRLAAVRAAWDRLLEVWID